LLTWSELHVFKPSVFALHFHFRQAAAVLLTACVFALHFQFWLVHMLNITCLPTVCVFALYHIW
jgi:hypothetical protein